MTAGVWCYLDCLVFEQGACFQYILPSLLAAADYRCRFRVGNGIFATLMNVSALFHPVADVWEIICVHALSALFSAYGHGWWWYDCVNMYQVPQALVLYSE